MADAAITQTKVPEVFDVFFSHTPNSNFVFPNGQLAAFVGGRYVTNEPAKAAYLQYEIDQGHPTIYRKPECLTLDKASLAPDAEYRKQVIAQYLAEQSAQTGKDMGSYEQGNLNVTDTSSLVQGAADSSSAADSASTGASTQSASAGAVVIGSGVLTGIKIGSM